MRFHGRGFWPKKTFERPQKKIAVNRPKMDQNHVQGYVGVCPSTKNTIFAPPEAVLVQNSAFLGQKQCFRANCDSQMRRRESAYFKNVICVSEGFDG